MTKQVQELNSEGRGVALVKARPQNRSYTKTQVTSPYKSKKVSFSQYSARRVYITDPYYEGRKSYSPADRNIFQTEAAQDASRINRLILSCPVEPRFAIHQLMEHGFLSREDLLGIEHLVGMNAKQAFRKRRSYIDFVLGVQKRMLENNENNVNAEELASLAVAKSSRTIEKARLRAALAL